MMMNELSNMNRQKRRTNVCIFLMLVGLVFLPFTAQASVETSLIDFGEVLIGTTASTVLTITNLDSANSIFVNLFFMRGTCDLSLGTQGINIQGGGVARVEVTYAPKTVATCSETLFLLYSAGQSESVTFMGTGVEEIKQSEPLGIESVLAFFNEAVEGGTLEGKGRGRSADMRLNVIKEMLMRAGRLIEKGHTNETVGLLKAIYKKVDGMKPPRNPRDFVKGDAADDLAAMIRQLIEQLGSHTKT